ncbi:hypothetical protein BDV25DRAFT_136358 [Aspergillus avenaceus]|uniref:Transcriptional regulator n=1 Tax=Aspergillus avenaceus TaxID=36643 RepID=A0A5N6U6D1_ASPAV|nr:hypothetical protein BDV25DRAFT_136358 [Aspergillus avenaceus]
MGPRRQRAVLSDSEAESDPETPSVPSDDALEKALRDVVAEIYKTGNMEELTVRRVRNAAEKALQVEEGFFKGDSTWKSKSDQVIKDEVEVQDKQAQDAGSDEDKASPPPKKTAPAKRTKTQAASTSRKRQKTNTPESDELSQSNSDPDDESEDEVKQPGRQSSSTREKGSESALSDKSAAEEDVKSEIEEKAEQEEGSESEMSVVLDEEPKPARKQQKSASSRGTSQGTSQKGKKKTTAKAPKTKDADLDPDQAEIKRLQGWLIKCGIRKMWARELAPFGSSKAKIKHLKEMLKDAGMEGRYSLDKAKKIKEERELKADLEMVQEGAKRWGTEGAKDDSEDDKPRRRLNRGRKSLAFLESDGEETD